VPVTLVTHPEYARHLTGTGHPERPARLRAILDALSGDEWDAHLRRREPDPIEPPLLGAVHAARYVDQVRALAEAGGGHLDPDTVVSPASYDVALLAAGGAVTAVRDALVDSGRAFAAVRPPGHHARPSHGMGFCLFNNVACAAEAAKASGKRRVFILDWDLHHGNGTQEIFYRRSDVMYCSLHQEHWYPGTGLIAETGEGEGAGFTINLPLPAGTGDEGYRHAFEEVVLPLLRSVGPDTLLISAGFDAHHADPLGGMLLSSSGFASFARLVVAEYTGPVAAVLEGGYDLAALGRSAAATIAVLAGIEPPAADDTPPGAEVGYAALRSRVREIRRVVRDVWSI
jgi:acetoin utilization deacetylase AcuC-like enzyme